MPPAPARSSVFSCFGAVADNVWATEVMAVVGAPVSHAGRYEPGPFAFADPAFVADLLAGAGWSDARPQRIDCRYRVGAGAHPFADAIDFLSRIGPVASSLRAVPRAPHRDRCPAGDDACPLPRR